MGFFLPLLLVFIIIPAFILSASGGYVRDHNGRWGPRDRWHHYRNPFHH